MNETRIYFKMSTKLHNLCDMLDAAAAAAVYVCTSMWIRLGMSRCFLYSRWVAQNCVSHSYPHRPPTVVSWMTFYERISIVSYNFSSFLLLTPHLHLVLTFCVLRRTKLTLPKIYGKYFWCLSTYLDEEVYDKRVGNGER